MDTLGHTCLQRRGIGQLQLDKVLLDIAPVDRSCLLVQSCQKKAAIESS